MRRLPAIARRMLVGIVMTLVLTTPALAVKVGDRAPDFTLTDSTGKPVKLAGMLGKGAVVIYTFISAQNAV
jgi:cytochrome oxidase Cu insertion factor (SCO1/SenC/PrrC family)